MTNEQVWEQLIKTHGKKNIHAMAGWAVIIKKVEKTKEAAMTALIDLLLNDCKEILKHKDLHASYTWSDKNDPVSCATALLQSNAFFNYVKTIQK